MGAYDDFTDVVKQTTIMRTLELLGITCKTLGRGL